MYNCNCVLCSVVYNAIIFIPKEEGNHATVTTWMNPEALC